MNSSKQLALTDSETLDEVLNCLTENISITTQGACDQKTVFEILIRAASSGDSIENTTKILNRLKQMLAFLRQVVERKYRTGALRYATIHFK